jgi:small nuclear ribonucleoprotein E
VAKNVIFKFLQSGSRIQVWLYDNLDFRLEGKLVVSNLIIIFVRLLFDNWLQGFDEFMNVVLDEATEIWMKNKKGREAGSREYLGTPFATSLMVHEG